MADTIAGVVLPDRPLTEFEAHVYSLAQQFATKTDGEDVSTPTTVPACLPTPTYPHSLSIL